MAAATAGAAAFSPLGIEDLGVTVPSGQSREYSYSDKEAGFYYGQTSTDDFSDWYAGWNIRAKRIFADYRLYVDGRMLSRKDAAVTVWPDRLERVYDCAVETFALVDSRKVLFVVLDGVAGSKVGIELTGTNVTLPRKDGNSVIYAAVEAQGDFVRISALNPDAQLSFDGKVVEAPRNAGGFIISYGNEQESRELASQSRSEGRQWLAQRQQRMQSLLQDNAMRTDLPSLDRALAWIELTASTEAGACTPASPGSPISGAGTCSSPCRERCSVPGSSTWPATSSSHLPATRIPTLTRRPTAACPTV